MSVPADDLHSAWAHLFAASLAQCGVAHAVISPGSRSTPLALALADHLPSTVLHDERAAAFFALGQARASGRPSVVLATSGTAPGHWLPAAMEAREAGLPAAETASLPLPASAPARSSAGFLSAARASRHLRTAAPNQSLKRSANGMPPGPGRGAVHSPQPGPGATPSSPG